MAHKKQLVRWEPSIGPDFRCRGSGLSFALLRSTRVVQRAERSSRWRPHSVDIIRHDRQL